MAEPVCIGTYSEPPFRMEEILRYAGAGGSGQEDILRLAEECAGLTRGRLSFRVCWREFPVTSDETGMDLGFARTDAASLRRRLAGCDRAVLFAATVGLEMDRLIVRYSAVSPARALMLQAVGAERIESLCDLFCEETARRAAREGRRTRPRFSPGYGDLPLELQRDIFRALDCQRAIGLTLNESLLMSPSKSVTALIGIGPDTGKAKETADVPDASGGCAGCGEIDCPYRKERNDEDH